MDYAVTYRRASQVAAIHGLLHVFLAAMQRREAPRPWLFRGSLAEPLLFRDCLLTLRDVVDSRFYRPDLWRLLDPVVSVEPEMVRLECFSSDGSVYARIDLLSDTFAEGETGAPGTTNVDFGPEFAARLATLRPGKDSAFEVGEDSVRLEAPAGAAIERKVKLPERWLRGFLQVQAIQRAAAPRMQLDRTRARALLAAAPPATPGGSTWWAGADGRLAPVRPPGASGAVAVRGMQRLRLLRRMLPLVNGLYVWSVADEAPSFWVADLGPARLTLGLSGSLDQGFSGDGEALRSSRQALDEGLLEHTRTLAAGTRRFSVADLARAAGVGEPEAAAAVDQLSEQGLLGYDLASGVFFPRHLPYVAGRDSTQSRERNSRRLEGEGRAAVELREPAAGAGIRLRGAVTGDHAVYRVEVILEPGGAIRDASCTCPWLLKHGMSRGPCKHILALRRAGEADAGA